MAVSPVQSRWMLSVCAALLAAVALVVVVGVIPSVRDTTAPDIYIEQAVPAFRAAVGLHLLAAMALLRTAAFSKGRSRISTPVLFATGVAILFFGFVLSDAARAFGAAGPSMQAVATLLFLCVAADVLAGALTLATAFLRPGSD